MRKPGRPKLPVEQVAVSKTFRVYLTQEAQLESMARGLNITESAVVRLAIEQLYKNTSRKLR
jgi:hypothetical protein